MAATLPIINVEKGRIYNVDYFIRRTERVKVGISGLTTLDATALVLDFPQQPNSVEVMDKHAYQTFYNVKGERIIRRPVATHKPKAIQLSFNISPHATVYPARGPRLETDITGSRAMRAVEVLKVFDDLVQEMRSGIYKYDLVDLSKSLVYKDCELDNFTVVQNAGTQRFGFTVTLMLTAFSSGADIGNIRQTKEKVVLPTRPEAAVGIFDRYLNAMATARSACLGVSTLIRSKTLLATDLVESAVGAPLSVINAAVSVPISAAAAIDGVLQTMDSIKTGILNTSSAAGLAIGQLALSIENVKRVYDQISDKGVVKVFKDYGGDIGSAATGAYYLGRYPALQIISYDQRYAPDTSVNSEQANQGVILNQLALALEDAELALELAHGYSYIRPALDAAVTTVGSFLDDSRNVSRLANYAGQPPSNASVADTSAVPYVLRLGESLIDIADRLTGDAARWIEIARLNGWTSPYTDSGDAVAPAGTRLFIPLDMISLVNDAANLNLIVNKGDPLLTDLRLVNDDISFEDFAELVGGIQNFEQALINRVKTPLGEVIGAPNYGVRDSRGSNNISFLANHVVSQLLSDPRVYSVSDVSVVLNGDLIDVNVKVLTVDQQTTQLVVPVN